jgi:hypothetical protein
MRRRISSTGMRSNAPRSGPPSGPSEGLSVKVSNGSATVSRCDVSAEAGIPVAHSHDGFEETIYGLEGVTTFTVDGEATPVGPGDTPVIAAADGPPDPQAMAAVMLRHGLTPVPS